MDTPIESLQAICAWVRKEITHDTKVSYSTRDTDAIFTHRAGWCGHRRTAFIALCSALNIPARTALGFSLRNKESLGMGGPIGIATLGLVELGRLGWIEIDPGGKRTIHDWRSSDSNPLRLQSHTLRVKRGGQWEPLRTYTNTVMARAK